MTGKRISKLLSQITILLIILCCSLSAQAKYGGGSGTPEDPYQIWDANHMQAIGADSNDWDKHFKLMADIDLSEYTGTEFNIIGVGRIECSLDLCWFVGTPFTGVFDGNGHTISNFTYEYSGDEFVGLFGCVDGESAQIKNLRLIDPNVDAGKDGVGSMVGYLEDGTITDCYVEGGTISGNHAVGGLIGTTGSTPQISNCHTTGNILGTGWHVGGLVGANSGTISNCYSKASAMGVNGVGGLAGGNLGTITDCYSMGSVGGNGFVGGLVGRNGFYYDLDCYPGSIISSYWDPQTSGEPNMCGFQADCSSGCDPNYGKTTVKMKQQATFEGWDFINVWNIGENQTYPYLRTYLAGDINKDGIVNFFDLAIEADQWLEEYYFGNRPPWILITYPEDGARLMVGGVPPQTVIWAEANDYDGSVVWVEFFVDDLKLGEDTDGSDGWSYLWQNYSLGFHVLTATAWDNEGLSQTSTPVNVEVWMSDPPPP